jgi:hypothetical protein
MELIDWGHPDDCSRVLGHPREREGHLMEAYRAKEQAAKSYGKRKPYKCRQASEAQTTKAENPTSATGPGVSTQYRRMATPQHPDWLAEPYQLSFWFAKGEGFNEPAKLRVLASQYLTAVSEIQHRLGGQPTDPAVYHELESRCQFLSFILPEFK